MVAEGLYIRKTWIKNPAFNSSFSPRLERKVIHKKEMNAVKKWVFCVVTRLVLDPKKTGSPSKQKESERKSNLLPGQGTEKKKNEALRK